MRAAGIALTAVLAIGHSHFSGSARAELSGSLSTAAGGAAVGEAGKALTLERCIDIALESSPRIAYGRALVDEAAAERDGAASRRWPSLRVEGAYSMYRDYEWLGPPGEPGQPLMFTDEIFSYGIFAEMPLFTAGRISKEIDAQELMRDSAEQNMGIIRGEIALEVASSWYRIAGGRMSLESLHASLSNLREYLENVEDRVSAGEADEAELICMRLAMADIEQEIVWVVASIEEEKDRLAALMGMDGGGSLAIPAAEIEPADPVASVDESMSRALSSRPDLIALRREIEAAERLVDAARAGFLPSLHLFAGYEAARATGDRLEMPGAEALDDGAEVGIMLEVPIFEGGSRGAALGAEKARLAATEARLRELELRIRTEVRSAARDLVSTRKRLDTINRALDMAGESLKIQTGRFDSGRCSAADIIDAETALLDMRMRRNEALAALNIAAARLRFVEGGGY